MMVLVGSIVLVLGIAAESSGLPAFKYVVIGIALSFLGFLLWNRLRKKKRNTRFSLFRKRERDDEESAKEDPWENRFYD